MKCQDARQLIPGYLDGELSEAQAGPLRQHLLTCPECRASAQDGKSLKGWFVDDEPAEIPAGFAARVARRAFAGDRGGDLADVGATHPLRALGSDAARVDGASAMVATGTGDRDISSFVLQLTAVAAALLIALSIGIRALELPSGNELLADDGSKEWVLEELDRLNADNASGSEAPQLDSRASRDERANGNGQ